MIRSLLHWKTLTIFGLATVWGTLVFKLVVGQSWPVAVTGALLCASGLGLAQAFGRRSRESELGRS